MKKRRSDAEEDQAVVQARKLARAHVPDSLAELARLAHSADSESARVAAIREMLDRAYGGGVAPGQGAGRLQTVLVDDGYDH